MECIFWICYVSFFISLRFQGCKATSKTSKNIQKHPKSIPSTKYSLFLFVWWCLFHNLFMSAACHINNGKKHMAFCWRFAAIWRLQETFFPICSAVRRKQNYGRWALWFVTTLSSPKPSETSDLVNRKFTCGMCLSSFFVEFSNINN